MCLIYILEFLIDTIVVNTFNQRYVLGYVKIL